MKILINAFYLFSFFYFIYDLDISTKNLTTKAIVISFKLQIYYNIFIKGIYIAYTLVLNANQLFLLLFSRLQNEAYKMPPSTSTIKTTK